MKELRQMKTAHSAIVPALTTGLAVASAETADNRLQYIELTAYDAATMTVAATDKQRVFHQEIKILSDTNTSHLVAQVHKRQIRAFLAGLSKTQENVQISFLTDQDNVTAVALGVSDWYVRAGAYDNPAWKSENLLDNYKLPKSSYMFHAYDWLEKLPEKLGHRPAGNILDTTKLFAMSFNQSIGLRMGLGKQLAEQGPGPDMRLQVYESENPPDKFHAVFIARFVKDMLNGIPSKGSPCFLHVDNSHGPMHIVQPSTGYRHMLMPLNIWSVHSVDANQWNFE